MLQLPVWSRCPLGVMLLSGKYEALRRGCPPLPPHMRVDIGSVQQLWQWYTPVGEDDEDEDEDEVGSQ